MKFITYRRHQHEQLAILKDGRVYDTDDFDVRFPDTMKELLARWDHYYPQLLHSGLRPERGAPMESFDLMAPVPYPSSCRDGYAFRQHVEAARRNRKVPMIPEFDQYPVFYFTNYQSIVGPGVITCMPDHLEKLDFELEAAIVICRKGRNIKAHEADSYIGGLMIMNDMSARTFQMEEMLLNLGPAKGKDFATAIGPWLVTPDELEKYVVAAKPGHTGKSWNLSMTCSVNGRQVSSGNLSDMDWTFAEIIARASYGVTLYPADVIGSGTVGTGCFLELNGTAKLHDAEYQEQWLQPGDIIDMEIEGLGRLTNKIEKDESGYSIRH